MTLEPKLFLRASQFCALRAVAWTYRIGMRNDRWPRHRHLQQKEDSSLDSYIC